jgi:hypothetical protein
MSKHYHLTAQDGSTYESDIPGELGGYGKVKIYGRLDYSSSIRSLPRGYARNRVFFKDEAAAMAADYRACGHCLSALPDLEDRRRTTGKVPKVKPS